MERQVIVIIGPTCSGKTYLSLKLAEYFKTEIISTDSRQIYKYLDIGTAKPSLQELKKIKHHFIDSLMPDEEFNVSKFEIEALQIINSMFKENKVPLIVGGSGLYIKALVDGIFNTVDTDEQYRDFLIKQMHAFGKEYLYEELKKVDPLSAQKMLPQNWKRVIRALEVFHLTGIPIWKLQTEYKRDTDIEFLQFGLNWNRDILYHNIEKRVDEMIDKGLINEVRKILEMGYGKELNSLNTVGYKEIVNYLENEITLERAIELIKRNTRRFAKRQMTWFRKDERIKWLDIASIDDLNNAANKIIG